MPDTNTLKSNDRRITVLAGLWRPLSELAERDHVSVADVANAILLQNLRPYGGCASVSTMQLPTSPFPIPSSDAVASLPSIPDPYQAAELDNW